MPGRRNRSFSRTIASLLVVIAGVTAAIALTGPIIHGIRTVTGGHRVADIVAGVLVLWLRVALIAGALVLARRRGHLQPRYLWLFVLFVPAVALSPWSRFGTDTALEHRVDASLPHFLTGLGTAWLVLAVPLLAYGGVLRWRRRQRPGRVSGAASTGPRWSGRR
jgi:hypothetical protein